MMEQKKVRPVYSILAVLLAAAAVLALAPFAVRAMSAGDVLLLEGRVLDTNGNPIPRSVVEIWQTDVNGNYDHPSDTSPADLLDTFQYFGTSATDETGFYSFRTIKPAAYGFRPSHIHVKVKQDGATLLTTQFYFAEDLQVVEGESIFRQAGDAGGRLILDATPSGGENGEPVYAADADILIDLDGGGTLDPTPSQAEGPYYPVVDFSGYDNDLTG